MRPSALLILCLFNQNIAAAEHIMLGEFSKVRLDSWESKAFKDQTDYQIVSDAGTKVLQAVSKASASGLYKKQQIDLSKTPFLNWRWKVANVLTGINEQTKAGDDYAARIYVLLDGGLRFWQTKSINYVWAGNTPKQKRWPNAYAGSALQMLALRSKVDKLNTWYSEKRNVREDFKKFLGLDIRTIDALALMTDTDNSGQAATAFYGDVYFSAD